MKVSELRQKTVAELKGEHLSLLREIFNLRIQKSSGQAGKSHQMKLARKTIARVLTVIHEKERSDA